MDEKDAKVLWKRLKSYFEQILTVIKDDVPIDDQLHPPVTHGDLYRYQFLKIFILSL